MKKITYAIVTVLLIGILCFFVFPDPSEENTEITIYFRIKLLQKDFTKYKI